MSAGSILYLCYQSVREPLTRTQVIAYLEGLSRAHYDVVLLTFEPTPVADSEEAAIRSELADLGIGWSWLRYHKRPTTLATAFDIVAGTIQSLRLIRRRRVGVVHARSHVPAAMALLITRLTHCKLVFDLRGFMAEEYVDAGIWLPTSPLVRLVKWVERAALRRANAVIVLTGAGEKLLRMWYAPELGSKPLAVIPCCVPVEAYVRETRRPPGEAPHFIYVGKLGGWYWTEALADFFRAARKEFPNARLSVITQSDPTPLLRLLHDVPAGALSTKRVNPEEVPNELAAADVALSFIKPCASKQASSPTKIGEYLAAGLPVISNAGIGDIDQLITGSGLTVEKPLGVLVATPSETAYREAAISAVALSRDLDTAQRCRKVARAQLDLTTVGWSRYRDLYRQLAG